jgi:mono/diheme cytochrome c family protein
MRSCFLIILTTLLLLPDLLAQEWTVPDDKKGKLSTFSFDDNTRKLGLKVYTTNCMSCHGAPGKGTFLKLVPPPPDPASDKMQKNSDGEMFYKVQTGKGQMPSFRNVLSSDEIWQVISYIRTFNPNYKQLIMPVITSSAYPGAVIKMVLSYNFADSSVVLNASAVKAASQEPVKNAGVKLFVYRTFGALAVDEEKTTDQAGRAVFRIPHSLPGDTAGNLRVSARFTNEDVFGSVSKDTVLHSAIKITPVSLTAQRAIWNVVQKAPLWILIAYPAGLLTALGFIILVFLKLRDVFIIGKQLRRTRVKKVPINFKD